jgi:TolA-binding protein
MKKLIFGLIILSTFIQHLNARIIPRSRRSVVSYYKDRKLFKKAETAYLNGEYDDAIPVYLQLLAGNPSGSKLNYQLGICYYYSSTSRPLAVTYLETAVANSKKDTASDLLYRQGLHICP